MRCYTYCGDEEECSAHRDLCDSAIYDVAESMDRRAFQYGKSGSEIRFDDLASTVICRVVNFPLEEMFIDPGGLAFMVISQVGEILE